MNKMIVFLFMPVLRLLFSSSSRRRHSLPVHYLISCFLLAGLAPSIVFGACSVPIVTSEVDIPQWNSNSGWLPLTNDPALRSSITQLKVTVTNNNFTAGNTLHVLENWQPLITANVDTTTTISIPASSTAATLSSISFMP